MLNVGFETRYEYGWCRTARLPRVFPNSAIRNPQSAIVRGVTFIEIMVVLLILGVFSMVAIPSMRGFHRQGKLSAAVREFVLTARYARQQAVLRNHSTEISIDSKSDTYRFVAEPDERRTHATSRNNRSEMEQVRKLGGTEKNRIHFATVEIGTDPFGRGESAWLRFRKDGSASACTVVVADATGQCVTIVIAGATGAVRTYAGPPREETIEIPEPEDAPPETDGEQTR
ncbi:GspH/FimT family pseudopilin [Candidatus Sumerlaeota bacterium]|nr:GspH/FimT family pseudopilin [Candidatus Sumerlaeota bacterium]